MAPELFDRARTADVGVQTDIWSLGCIFIELFSNKRPWSYISSSKVSNVYYEIFKRKPIPIPDVILPEIRGLIAQCCDYDSFKRPTANRILNVLEGIKC